MKKDIAKIQETQDKMQDELTRLGDTVTVIEVEHGRKIDIMLDVLTGHTEKLEEYEQRFKKDEKIIEMHSHRIYALEAKK